MKAKQLEETKRAVMADWMKVKHLNHHGFTDAWLDGALKMRGVFATARTFNEVRAYIRGELAVAEMVARTAPKSPVCGGRYCAKDGCECICDWMRTPHPCDACFDPCNDAAGKLSTGACR